MGVWLDLCFQKSLIAEQGKDWRVRDWKPGSECVAVVRILVLVVLVEGS